MGADAKMVLNQIVMALLVYTYDAAIEESPHGRERLELVRGAVIAKGLDIADRDDRRVRDFLALASTVISASEPGTPPATE